MGFPVHSRPHCSASLGQGCTRGSAITVARIRTRRISAPASSAMRVFRRRGTSIDSMPWRAECTATVPASPPDSSPDRLGDDAECAPDRRCPSGPGEEHA